jgi:DNA-directed RNA polymerase specialized sigma24 family protein
MEFRAEATSEGDGMGKGVSQSRWRLLIDSLPALHAYVNRLVADGDRANEILQEASVRMLASEGPSEPERYAAWGRGVIRHVMAHDWRMRRRALTEQPLADDVLDEVSDASIDAEAHLDARASIARIADDLDGDGLRLLYRRYVLQESGRELADEMAQSPAAIRMRLMRLRSRALAVRGMSRADLIGAESEPAEGPNVPR